IQTNWRQTGVDLSNASFWLFCLSNGTEKQSVSAFRGLSWILTVTSNVFVSAEDSYFAFGCDSDCAFEHLYPFYQSHHLDD
ncbi:hypothetical protein H0H93_005539, partial [Arthromyces matolae]